MFTDYQMPRMNGLELAQWVRSRRPGIPVLVTTGNPDLIAQSGREHPTFVIRPKPWLPHELTAAVSNLLAAAAV
jgi:CheY-like chemotaxis protein